MIRTLYLAGPDVFRPDAAGHARQLKALCARHGFEGLFPLDAQVHEQAVATAAERAAWIYRADVGLLDRADAVLANLDFFRGAEPDSGTCFEIGYAVAKGKPVYGYVPETGSWAERIRARHPQMAGADPSVDVAGWELEEFGLPLNLMLAVPAVVVAGGAEAALARLRADLDAGRLGAAA
ncbi:nucleoside 2-deoxyribosyltransferase [Xanthomonas massiliensis]|uniref:nucleoside 2-deoxyribosyltransferase n=1 Tax=Xanthomonas massiliensis TaxID=1720302 RepID=UPI0008262CDA|nr:nucleoside 2-deoxyribosyltransferase [Xanthomonas massiliensis]